MHVALEINVLKMGVPVCVYKGYAGADCKQAISMKHSPLPMHAEVSSIYIILILILQAMISGLQAPIQRYIACNKLEKLDNRLHACMHVHVHHYCVSLSLCDIVKAINILCMEDNNLKICVNCHIIVRLRGQISSTQHIEPQA